MALWAVAWKVSLARLAAALVMAGVSEEGQKHCVGDKYNLA
jgi:hypothetical protein